MADSKSSPHFLAKLKESVESRTGLAFGDTLNVSLFILTAISFFVAVGGVYFAYITLKEARDAGAAQEKATKQAQSALDTSAARLEQVKGVLDESLKAAQQERDLLNKSTDAAKAMATTMRQLSKNVEDLPGAIPILATRIMCQDFPEGGVHNQALETVWLFGLEDYDNVGRYTAGKKWFYGKSWYVGHLAFLTDHTYACSLTVANVGNRVLESYSLGLELDSKAGTEIHIKPDFDSEYLRVGNGKDALDDWTSGGPLAPSENGSGDHRFFFLRMVLPEGKHVRRSATLFMHYGVGRAVPIIVTGYRAD